MTRLKQILTWSDQSNNAVVKPLYLQKSLCLKKNIYLTFLEKNYVYKVGSQLS